MSLRPLYDKIIVKRLEAELATPAGIIIPDAAKEKPQKGVVLAVGEGRLLVDGDLRSLSVKVGDIVLFGRFSGTEVKVNDLERIIMREDDILAIIEG